MPEQNFCHLSECFLKSLSPYNGNYNDSFRGFGLQRADISQIFQTFNNSSRFVYMGVLLFAIDKYHPLSIVIDDIYNFCNVFFTVRPGKEDSL